MYLALILIGIIMGLMIAIEMARLSTKREEQDYDEQTKDKGKRPDDWPP